MGEPDTFYWGLTLSTPPYAMHVVDDRGCPGCGSGTDYGQRKNPRYVAYAFKNCSGNGTKSHKPKSFFFTYERTVGDV